MHKCITDIQLDVTVLGNLKKQSIKCIGTQVLEVYKWAKVEKVMFML